MTSLLIQASIAGALAAGAVWAVTRLFPSISASARTLLWWCVAARFMIALVPMAAIAVPVLPASPSGTVAAVEPAALPSLPFAGDSTSLPATDVERTSPDPRLNPAALVDDAIAGVWIVGIATIAVVSFRRRRQLRRAVRNSSEAPATVLAEARALAQGFGIARVPVIRESADVDAPLVTGFLSPTVLLPRGFDALPREAQRMSLCHELAHVMRNDLRAGCVPALSNTLFFFHPLAALTSREYALAREAACDAVVLGALDVEPADYGRLLVRYSLAKGHAGLATAGVSTSARQLKRRLLMLDQSKRALRRPDFRLAIAVAVAAVIVVPLRVVARQTAHTTTVVRTVPVTPPPELRNMIEGGIHARGGVADLRIEFILVHDDHNFTWGRLGMVEQITQRVPPKPLATHGDPSVFDMELARVQRVRTPGEPMFWFIKNGFDYVIRDSATLASIDAVWKPRKTLAFYQDYVGQVGTSRSVRDLTPAEREMREKELAARIAELRKQVTDLTARLSNASLDSKMGSPTSQVGMGLPMLAQAIQQTTRPGEYDVERIIDHAFNAGLVSRLPTEMESLPVISGTVRTPEGSADPTTWVLLFAADHERYVAEGMSAHQAKTAPDGTYRIPVLNPGNYYVIAVPAAEKNGWLRPEKYGQVQTLGTKVHSETRDMTVTLTTKR